MSTRVGIIIAASIGFFIAFYMGLFQISVVKTVWDPFFGNGSEEVLTSDISYALPIPDSMLGAIVNFIDVVTGSCGGSEVWLLMVPWILGYDNRIAILTNSTSGFNCYRVIFYKRKNWTHLLWWMAGTLEIQLSLRKHSQKNKGHTKK